MADSSLKESITRTTIWKTLIALGLFVYLILIPFTSTPSLRPFLLRWSDFPAVETDKTNLSHIAFGLMGSVKTWQHRRGYQEAWWRPNQTRGYVYLDRPPTPNLLPWPATAPPYRVVDNITHLFRERKPRFELMPRMVHGILEVFREEHDGLRWIVMGDDDSVFFVDNIVDVLSEYDHMKYYYLGWHSESVISNYWFSFDQAFGGGGIVLSYALAKALVDDMDGCLVRYSQSRSADLLTMTCIADIGVNLTPHKGIHQVDLHGDFSGYLSAHPNVPVLTFHHLDAVDPIFPGLNRFQSINHLMQAAGADQSRLLQQIICYHRSVNWSISVAWGYSVHVYEAVHPRSYLHQPIETFKPWAKGPRPPFYMFNTRPRSADPCQAPHVFFLDSVYRTVGGERILTNYGRARPRGLPACASAGNHSADGLNSIRLFSPAHKKIQTDRCECCDIVGVDGGNVDVKVRECKKGEIIA